MICTMPGYTSLIVNGCDAVRHMYVLSQNGERESSSEITMIKWFHSKISIKNCY